MNAIQYTLTNNIAYITLNRPDAFNSVDAQLAKELIEALDDCQAKDEIRVIVITGNGRAFCAGQDLKEVTDPDRHPGFERLLKERYTPIIHKITQLEKPVIAAVNGVAAGAGANIALACDIILAHEKASFIQAFSAIGLIPDSGGTYYLPRSIGRAKATAYMMLGDKISAKEAERVGMIYKWLPEEEFEETVSTLASRLSTMATKGLGLTKKAINNSLNNTFEEQMNLETQLQIQASETADYAEGVSAFIQKRKPIFKGK